jgi:hypothetical protein
LVGDVPEGLAQLFLVLVDHGVEIRLPQFRGLLKPFQ